MLKIQKSQEIEMSKSAMRSFEDRMIEHIEKFFPDHYAALQQENTRVLIQYGIDQAANYGIVAESDVCKYIDLMIAFGVEFDTDPRTSWAGDILNDESISDPGEKIDAVHDEGIRQLKESPEWTKAGRQ